MTDRQATPSPEIDSPENATAQATRTSDGRQVTHAGQQPTSVLATAQALAATQRTECLETRPWFKRKRFALPLSVLAVFTIIMVTTGGNDSGLFKAVTNAVQPTPPLTAKAPPATAVMGQSVRDGKFAFTVTSLQPAAKSFTDRSGTTQTAQGIFVIVRLNVTNIGYETRSLNPTDLFLIDDRGKRFATSSAISSLAGAETVFEQKINPGRTVNNAPVLFDVSPGTVLTSIELHDSNSSTGVQVKLP